MASDYAVDGLLFDLDGVVVDSERARDTVMAEFIASFGKTYDRERTKPFLAGKPDLEVATIIKRRYDLPGTPQEIKDARTTSIHRLYADTIPFVPGFLEFYKGLRAAFPQARVAAASGMDVPYFDAIDARLSLTSLFDGNVFLSHRLKIRSKPLPDIFFHAARNIGADPASCVVFEDAPNGLIAATGAQMLKIAFTRTFGEQVLRDYVRNQLGWEPHALYVDEFNAKSLKRVIRYVRG